MNPKTPWPTKRLLLAAVAASTLIVVSPPAAAGQDRSWDRYRILMERNMFHRDRRSVRSYPAATTQPSEQYTYDSDGSIVLKGIAKNDGQFVAVFEDVRTRAVTKARVGQAVGKGKVERITLDEVQYDREGTIRRIGIGFSLMGTTATVTAAADGADGPTAAGDEPTTRPAESAATTRPASSDTSPKETTDSDISDILEQMRRRREQELRR